MKATFDSLYVARSVIIDLRCRLQREEYALNRAHDTVVQLRGELEEKEREFDALLRQFKAEPTAQEDKNG